MRLLQLNWVVSSRDEEQLQQLVGQAAGSEQLLALLVEWSEREKSQLDSQMKLSNIKDKPDRAELALVAYAQREILDKLIKLLDTENLGE